MPKKLKKPRVGQTPTLPTPKQPDADQIGALTVEEFCRAYGLGRTHVYAVIATGRLRARKSGTRTLILKKDIRAWEESLNMLEGASCP
jgi:excisionase family DNA binding protein